MLSREYSATALCRKCKFWVLVDNQDGEQLGQCRRFPPAYEGWAMTRQDDWCGEWQALQRQVDEPGRHVSFG